MAETNDGLEKDGQGLRCRTKKCQEVIHRYRIKVSTLYEDYVDGHINCKKYLSQKKELLERQQDVEHSFAALNE